MVSTFLDLAGSPRSQIGDNSIVEIIKQTILKTTLVQIRLKAPEGGAA